MPAFAPHTPVKTPARPPKRPSSPAVVRTRVPAATAASEKPGPAVKLKIAAAAKDPHFKLMLDKLDQSASKARSYPPAGTKAAEAQAAALPPANEKLAGARANQVDAMESAETKKPENESFLSLLRAEIQKVMPKKTEDAGDFMKGEDRQQLKGAMTGNVQQQKGEATAGMQSASQAPPDTSTVPGKEVVALPAEGTPAAPPMVDAAQAMPAPKSAQETSLEQGKKDTNKLLTDAEVTTSQLQKANDPRFTAVVTEKAKTDQYADTGPKQYQTEEQKTLAQAAAQAAGDEKKGLAGFLAQGGKALKAVRGGQLSAKEKDELERKQVTNHIQGIFDKTKATVDKKLAGLDEEVSRIFDQGADAAVVKMKDYVEKRFDERYSGISGKALWLEDKLLPLPFAVKAWFSEAHKVFLEEMDALVVRVANLVETRLKEAKDEITKGQKEIRDYVQSLPDNLKAVGKAAEKEMNSRFDELRQGVDDKKNDLAQKLAQRYKDACDKGEKALQEMKDAHKSLYERGRDAIAEVIKVLREFRNKIVAMLKKGKNTVDLIVADPIGFLKNLLNAVKKGIGQFVDNIWTHLKEGFMGWLFGSLAESGVTVPKDLSLPSILKLVLQIIGLTYERLRAKAVKLLGERAVTVIEQAAKFIWTLVTEGPAKLWEMMKEYLGNLKEMVINAIQEWVVTTVIKAAVTKLISMFNPVGAIIQAIMTIYNVVMFFIERINQIAAFVESIINSVYEIATGAIGAAANWIEKSLGRTVPLIIAFLARLLGITGITEKIVGIIKKIQAKVDQAIDKVINKVVAGSKKVVGAVKGEAAKLAVAIFPKKKIVLQDKTHTMEVEEEERGYEVVIYSERMRVHEVIEKARKVDANAAGKLEKEYKEWRSMPKPKDPTKEKDVYAKRSAKYEKIYTLAADVLEKLDSTETLTKVEWFGLDSEGRAQGLSANPLTQKGLKGSAPREAIPGWDTGLEYKNEKIAYIRAHLLHEKLGGPGRSFNLTPTSNYFNRQRIYPAVEERALKEINDGKTLIYTVKVDYKEPTEEQMQKVKPPEKKHLLKYVAHKITISVKDKKTQKNIVPRFSETNYE